MNFLRIGLSLLLVASASPFFIELNSLTPEMCVLFYADGKRANHQIDYIILDGSSQNDITVKSYNFDTKDEVGLSPASIGSNSFRLLIDNYSNPKLKVCFAIRVPKKEIRIKIPNINKSVYTNKKDISRSASLMKTFEEESRKFNERVIEEAKRVEQNMQDVEKTNSYLYYILGIKIYLLVVAAAIQVMVIVKKVLTKSKVDFV